MKVIAFEAQAARTPDAIAIVADDRHVTYAGLNRRANQWARHLRRQGAGVGTVVGVGLERSADLVIALIAIQKSGAAYLPLDPAVPAERWRQLLTESRATCVLTSAALRTRLAEDAPCGVVDNPTTRRAVDAYAPDDLTDADRGGMLTPAHPAYVMYTSGSSGVSKGVVVTHQNVMALCAATDQRFEFQSDDVWTVFHSVAFDFSVWEIYRPLLQGACVVIVPYATSRSPRDFLRLLVRAQVTVLNQTPSAFYELMQAEEAQPELGAALALRYVIFGGEALTFARLEAWYRRHAADMPTLVNMYGITETTVHVTHLVVTPDMSRSAQNLIGARLPHLSVYVLDDALAPVAMGVTGEVYVAGGGVAHGYLHQAGLTAARFVADPYGAPGTRMYRSGDLAQWRPDGTLAYGGRVDDQIKVRGFRIELSEIEVALRAEGGVLDAVVIARDVERSDTPQLVGYVRPAPAQVLDARALREHLGRRVPDYMVPAAIVIMDVWPLTANGKLDRHALPAPDMSLQQATYRAPRIPAEEILCGLFAEVLGVGRVGLDDDFFALGGHSLGVIRLVSGIRAMLGVELPIRTLFEHPTVSEVIDQVGAAGAAGAAGRPLAAAPRPAVLPLSYAQQRLWFLHRLDPASLAYHIPHAMRLRGPLRVAALQAAFGDVVTRHESLRTRFPEDEGVPRQEIVDATHVPLLVVPATAAALAAEIAAVMGAPFDLTADVPVRAVVYRLDANTHVLLLVLHHIASDGWSMTLLERDLATAYAARCAGTPPTWTPLPVQYADYALWQREVLGREDDPTSALAQQLAYWTQQLAALPEQTALPIDYPRPAVASHAGDVVPLRIDAATHAGLLAVARAAHASLFMVVQAGLAALLTRLGAGTDVPIGTPIAGRTDRAVEELVGFFVNTLVLRTDTSGQPTFATLVERVRSTALAAYAHADVPFEQVVEALQPARSLGRHPLTQVLLTVDEMRQGLPTWPGLAAVREPVRLDVAKLDLLVNLTDGRDASGAPVGLIGGVGYRTDLFARLTIDAIAARLERVLRNMAADSSQLISAVELLDPAERAELLAQSAGPVERVEAASAQALFEAQVARTPEAVAVVADAQHVTYAALQQWAQQWGRQLRAVGIGPESLVGVAVDRSLAWPLACLAVWTAGAGYVALDPHWPTARLAAIMAQTLLPIVLTERRVRDRLPATTALVVCLDDEGTLDAAAMEETGPYPGPPAAAVAYVIHTSGSTGTPKGVVVPHAGLPSLATAQVARAVVTADARVVQFAEASFDASVSELLMALTAGATLILLPRAARAGAPLHAHLVRHGVTHATFPPVVLETLTTAPPGPLQSVLVAGDACPPAVAGAWAGRVRLVNAYGPTETTVCATMSAPLTGAEVPIGRPLPNTTSYVLDARLTLVPRGVAGELYVGGVGVARGYLGQPAHTAERFVANPFGPAGTRLYRTGDLVVWRADGMLTFRGRADHQVKVRGVRVELGEVEAALRAQAGVAQAVVVARADAHGETHLNGYVVAPPGQPLEGSALREQLRARLPDALVPTAVVVLDAWPLTTSGKVDRQALPAPDVRVPEATYRAPRTPAEARLCGVFAEVLGVDQVGLDDDFFALGGHSLLALRLVSRIRATLGVELSIHTLFEGATVAAIAEQHGSAALTLLPLDRRSRPTTIPLSYAQQRLWFLHRLDPDSIAYHIPRALRLRGSLNVPALRVAFVDLLGRHESLRTRFPDRRSSDLSWSSYS